VPNLPERVGIPFNNNVIDIAHQIRLGENKYTRTVCLLVYVPTSYVLRVYKNARHRPKQSSYVPNLPGRVEIPFNYNTIIFKPLIRFYENWAYTYCMSTCVQRAAASVLRT